MTRFVLASVVASSVASIASAGFTSFSVEQSTNASGNTVFKIFANFDNAGLGAGQNWVFLNVFGHTTASGSMNAFHSGTGAGTWVPQGTSSAAHVGNDSWVTSTGTHVGSQVALDPGFVEFDSYGEPIPGVDAQIPNGAGWYDATPGTANNIANNKIQIMQIVRAGGAGDEYVANLQIGFKVSGTTTAIFGQGSYSIGVPVPAPGAVALLGLAGLAGRRRR
jgi:hypothetical protein